MWNQFAGALGDATLQNLSSLASMQPGDIKEAIEASATGAVRRTKLRLVFAAPRLKGDLDPHFQQCPLSGWLLACVVGHHHTKSTWASVLDQASDREVESLPLEVLGKLRARFRAVEGEDPMKAEEVTDDQLSVICSVVQAGIAPFADFGVSHKVSRTNLCQRELATCVPYMAFKSFQIVLSFRMFFGGRTNTSSSIAAWKNATDTSHKPSQRS